jgi:hypothetical protein
MKALTITIAVLVVAVLVVLFVVSRRSTVRPKEELGGIDQSKPSSSYEQKTNHFPKPSYDLGPIQGEVSPFQVNQFLSYSV